MAAPWHDQKIGLASVTFLGTADPDLFRLQLAQIERNSAAYDVTLYLAMPRVGDAERRIAAESPRVTVVDTGRPDLMPNEEHAFHLGRLWQAALADNCQILGAFDVDSFPIVPHWLERIAPTEGRVSAVCRSENGDSFLPHPCGLFMESSFFEDYRPILWPSDALKADPDYQRFLAGTGQYVDTGIPVGFTLWQHDEPWRRLERSNAVDLHPLMAGVYADTIFHLGAMSRAPRFRTDSKSYPILSYCRETMVSTPLWRLGRFAGQTMARKNGRIHDVIVRRLLSDPQGLFDELRGVSNNPALGG